MVTYAPPGYLLFVRDRTLVAQEFDWKSRKTRGEPRPLAEQIGTNSVGLALFSVSRDGVLAYRTGESGARLRWLDRSGKELSVEGDVGEIASPSLSPAGDRIVFDMTDPRAGHEDIWIRDIKRGVSSRFTFETSKEIGPIWSPDGTRIAFASDKDGNYDIYEKTATGVGSEKVLVADDAFKYPTGWSRDGRYLLYCRQDPKTNWDIWALPTFGDGKPIPVVRSAFNDNNAYLSPDGRYILYQSNESGRGEVYVQSFPGPGGKWQVSSEGGNDASWRSDGREIFYRTPAQQLMVVEVAGGAEFVAGIPKPLYPAAFQTGTMRTKYAAAADGQRFLVLSPLGRDAMTPMTIVVNWAADLAK
jgi:Tol biopolymer transport system component